MHKAGPGMPEQFGDGFHFVGKLGPESFRVVVLVNLQRSPNGFTQNRLGLGRIVNAVLTVSDGVLDSLLKLLPLPLQLLQARGCFRVEPHSPATRISEEKISASRRRSWSVTGA